MLLNPFQLHQPQTIEKALDILQNHKDLRICAGGTFVIKNLKTQKEKGLKTPAHILSLQHIPLLREINYKPNKLTIGSMVALQELINSMEINKNAPLLARACRQIATQPIRNMATIGGNLTGRYTWSELPSVCIALEATYYLAGRNSKKIRIPAEEFSNRQGQADGILETIELIPNRFNRFSYHRVSRRSPVDLPLFSIAGTAVVENQTFKEIRLVINNGLQFAQRDRQLETFLRDKPAKEEILDQALGHQDQSLYQADTLSKKNAFKVGLKKVLRDIIIDKNNDVQYQ